MDFHLLILERYEWQPKCNGHPGWQPRVIDNQGMDQAFIFCNVIGFLSF